MKKAFTMIELVFVIVILGILAGVAIPRLAATREDAEIAAAIANMRTLISDARSYLVVRDKFDINTRWNEITNVPLINDDKQVLGIVGGFTVGGEMCIDLQIRNKIANVPAHITFIKYPRQNNNLCKQVLESPPIKAYFDSKAGPLPSSVIIGPTMSIYD